MECGDEQASVQIPHLQRTVPKRGNRPLPVRRHRHARDMTTVAFQRAQQRGARRVKLGMQRPQPRRRRASGAKDGKVTAYIPDALPGTAITSADEGVAADAKGNVYGAEVGPKDVKKYVK